MGTISGIVTHANGQPNTMAYVSAAVGGVTSGVPPGAKTDSRGRFTLSWSGDADADVVFVDGVEAARGIKNGASNLHLLTAAGSQWQAQG